MRQGWHDILYMHFVLQRDLPQLPSKVRANIFRYGQCPDLVVAELLTQLNRGLAVAGLPHMDKTDT
jgi:hypothetical protein